MAERDDIRGIAATLPGMTETSGGQVGGWAWRTKSGLVVWERKPSGVDLRQLASLDRTWPEGTVIALRTDGQEPKEMLLASDPAVFFSIPHLEGYDAVLCRLDRIDRDYLAELIIEAWLTRVPKRVAREWLAEHGLEE